MRTTAMIKRGLESLAAGFIMSPDILMARTLMLGYKKFKWPKKDIQRKKKI